MTAQIIQFPDLKRRRMGKAWLEMKHRFEKNYRVEIPVDEEQFLATVDYLTNAELIELHQILC